MSQLHTETATTIRAAVPQALRGLGVASLVLGGLVMVAAMLGVFLAGGALATAWAVIALLAIAPAAAIVTAVARIRGRGARFSYDDTGFENRTARFGLGERDAQWAQVSSLEVDGEALVINLDGDRRSLVHAAVLGYSPERLGATLRPLVGQPFDPHSALG